MSELKVNTISEVTGANGVVIDSVKLKDGEVYATKIQYTDGDDAITIADGGGITVAQAATFSSTIDSGAITSTGIVTGTAFTAGSAVLAEAELELLDGLTAGTAIASKVVTTDANIDTTGQRNLTISGELDAATLDISGAIDVAGTTNLDVVDIDGAVDMASTLQVDGVATFSAVPVFPNNTIETADIQADAITAAKIADNAVVTAGINADAITAAKIADNAVVTAGINADAVTGAKIADDAINSEHYTDGSIDTAHLADGQVTIGKLATAVLTGATDIGAAIVDADLLLIDDGAGGTLRKTAASRLKKYLPSILQHVSNSETTTRSTTSTSFGVNSNTLQVDITPYSTTSKLLIFVNAIGYNSTNGADNFYTIYRDSSDLGNSNKGLAQLKNTSGTHSNVGAVTMFIVDVPNTTDEITYGVNFRCGSGTAFLGHNATRNYIHVLEVGA